jgi:hypothetical protein
MDDGIGNTFSRAAKRAGLANAMQRNPEMFAPGAFEAYNSMTEADWKKMEGFGDQSGGVMGKFEGPRRGVASWGDAFGPDFSYYPSNKEDLAAAWPKHAGPIPEHLMPESYANPPPLFNRPLPVNPLTVPRWAQERGPYRP